MVAHHYHHYCWVRCCSSWDLYYLLTPEDNSLANARSCNGIDCQSNLNIEIVGELPASFDVEVRYFQNTFPPQNSYAKFRCQNKTYIQESLVSLKPENFKTELGYYLTDICFNNYITSLHAPFQFSLRITWEGGSYEETVIPEYTVGGNGCDLICRWADIRLEVN